ncbi:uncharacterized protein LOC142818140 isoform X1 [Rhipicephalus microplus]|nr:uncharacterized protein LOC119183458 [Rhipicephalus microplus]
MSTSKNNRKRYLEPDAWNDRLPKSTHYEVRKNATARSTPPAMDVGSEHVVTSASESSDDDEASVSVEDIGRENNIVGEESAGDCDTDDELSDQLSNATEPSDALPSSNFFRLEFARPLGNANTLSVGDALVLVMDFAIKHGLSWTAIEDLLKLCNNILGTNLLPNSKYLFRKFTATSPQDMKFYFYCPFCNRLLAKTGGSLSERNSLTGMCCGKGYTGRKLTADGSFFVGLPLKKQISSVLADDGLREDLYKSLNEKKDTENASVSDVTDGAFYLTQRKKLGCQKDDITLTVSADGSPVFKSTNYSIWPVHLTVNELPPHRRWSNIICALLWYGTKHPDMTLVLEAFAEQMNELSTEGICWNVNGRQVHSKVYCITAVADAPARASMQNVLQFNGYYGCSWCLHPGEFIEGCVKYPVGSTFEDRTAASMLTDMQMAAKMKRSIKGVKGPSPLLNVPGFDIVWSFRPDYMHAVLLGVVRQVTELWFSDTGRACYIGSPRTLREADERLLSQRPPVCFNRTPRSLKLRKYWKASEWESWLLFYSLPCLKGILPAQFLEHFALLVSSVYTLLKSHVTSQEIDDCTLEITKFVVMTECNYEKAQMTSNMHTLLHLPKSVLLHGPLWAISCFEFESNMGNLVRLVSSSNGIPFQILSRILLMSNFNQLLSMASEEVKELCLHTKKKCMGVKLLGKPQVPSHDLMEFVNGKITGVQRIEEHSRICVNGCIMHTDNYNPGSRKRDSTAGKLGDDYVKIENIFNVCKVDGSSEIFIVSHNYQVKSFEGVSHLKVARKCASKAIHSISRSLRPCIYLNLNGTMFFAELCNRYGSF